MEDQDGSLGRLTTASLLVYLYPLPTRAWTYNAQVQETRSNARLGRAGRKFVMATQSVSMLLLRCTTAGLGFNVLLTSRCSNSETPKTTGVL